MNTIIKGSGKESIHNVNRRKIRVYVSGPITNIEQNGSVGRNIRIAVQAAVELVRKGYYPYIPHLDFLVEVIAPLEYDEYLDQDFAWIEACDAVLRIPGKSPGGEKEVAFAQGSGIQIFYNIEALDQYFTYGLGRYHD